MYWNWGFPASTYDPGVATGSAGACAGAAVGLADGAGAEIVDGAPLEPDESPLFAAASGLLDCGETVGGLDAGTAGARSARIITGWPRGLVEALDEMFCGARCRHKLLRG